MVEREGRVSVAEGRNKATAAAVTAATTQGRAARTLGAFLRRMRDRARPVAQATRSSRRRRAVGLRREEVAVEAGISATWYTWLEQGRFLRVSQDTLIAIARALRLTEMEERHLMRLAAAAHAPDAPLTMAASTSLRAVVNALAPHAAYAVNGRWDVLHANPAAAGLLGAFDEQPGRTDNILRRLFLDERWGSLFEQWEAVTEGAVAQFRLETANMIADARWAEFISALSSESQAFADLWARHDLAEPLARQKIIRHPELGRVRLLYASVAPDAEPDDVRVIFYSAENTP